MKDEIGILSKIFKALSDPTRLQILEILEAGPRPVNEIVDFFNLAQPTISRHLAALANAGLVVCKKAEQQRIYGLNQEVLVMMARNFFAIFASCRGLDLSSKPRK